MTRRNRVTPFGILEAAAVRGAMMGNRGNLHDAQGAITQSWRLERWICCVTVFGQHRVTFDTPGRYTPLFFSDEAVALAAGHRPCALCRKDAYDSFVTCYKRAHAIPPQRFVRATEIDAHLHRMRIQRGRQLTFSARLGDLPVATFVTRGNAPHQPMVVRSGETMRWTHHGYGPAEPIDPEETVDVLTPAPIVAALREGYRPQYPWGTCHDS